MAGAVAGAVAFTAAVLPRPPAEAAGWLATPTASAGAARAGLATQCQQMMETSAPAVLVERRGTSNLTLLADSTVCLNAPVGLDVPVPVNAGGRDTVPPVEPGVDEVQVVHHDSLGGIGRGDVTDGTMTAGYMGVTGRVGADVRSVVIHTGNLGNVTASLQNGWFAAWWPSLDRPTSLTVTTATGVYDQAL